MNIPQILIIIILGIECGCNLAKDGQVKTDKYSFCGSLFAAGIVVLILGFGGFWK